MGDPRVTEFFRNPSSLQRPALDQGDSWHCARRGLRSPVRVSIELTFIFVAPCSVWVGDKRNAVHPISGLFFCSNCDCLRDKSALIMFGSSLYLATVMSDSCVGTCARFNLWEEVIVVLLPSLLVCDC